MTARRPLVIAEGRSKELPANDEFLISTVATLPVSAAPGALLRLSSDGKLYKCVPAGNAWVALSEGASVAGAAAPSMGYTNKIVDGGGVSQPVISIPAGTTQASRSSFLLGLLMNQTGLATSGPSGNGITDTYNNAWKLLFFVPNYSGQFGLAVYGAINGIGGTNHAVNIAKAAGWDQAGVSGFFAEIKDATQLDGFSVGGVSATNPITTPAIFFGSPNAFVVGFEAGAGFASGYVQTASGFTNVQEETAPAGVTSQGALAYQVAANGVRNTKAIWNSVPAQGGAAILIAFTNGGANANGVRNTTLHFDKVTQCPTTVNVIAPGVTLGSTILPSIGAAPDTGEWDTDDLEGFSVAALAKNGSIDFTLFAPVPVAGPIPVSFAVS